MFKVLTDIKSIHYRNNRVTSSDELIIVIDPAPTETPTPTPDPRPDGAGGGAGVQNEMSVGAGRVGNRKNFWKSGWGGHSGVKASFSKIILAQFLV